MAIQTFPVILEDAFMLSAKVKHFVFKAENIPAFNYIAGQFITIHFTVNDKLLKRSYSIANVPEQNNRIEFAAGYFPGGPGTELLYNLKPGDQITLSGPYGRLILKEETPKRYIFIATSTGITPYRAMLTVLQERLALNPNLEIVILEGVQKREEVLYYDEFLAFANQNPQVRFYALLSREEGNNLAAHEKIGYVQHALPELNLNPANDLVYICGNPSMIDETFDYLKERGFELPQIIREKYISAPTKQN